MPGPTDRTAPTAPGSRCPATPEKPLIVLARTTSARETRALAAAVADLLEPGDVLLLSGEMGAGKTAFTQGLGAALGFTGRVTSPTFTIAHTYEGGRLRIHHLDVYRLEHLHEALDVGLAEMVDEGAVVVIEWGDAISPLLPADHLDLRISFAPPGADGDVDEGDDDVRRWEVVTAGERWSRRQAALIAALAPWADEPC